MEAQEMIKMKTWAVVGASNKKGGYGYKIYRKLKEAGYTVYPVTPNFEEVDGDQAYRSVLDLPEVVDVAELIIKPEVAKKVIKEVLKAGIKNVWLQPMARSIELTNMLVDQDINVVESCVLYELKQK